MKKIGFVGAGNMAGALLKGMLQAGQLKPDDVWASDPVDAQLRRMKRLHKIETTRDNRLLVRQSQTILLAVKPQAMAGLLDEIRAEVNPRKLFISIAAGFPLRRLEAGLGGQARVVRVMPNTPVLVGRGISVAVAGAKATPADLKQTLKLFKAVGEAVSITGEDLLDAVTALSGSGPAFVYMFAEALIEGGVRGGLPQSLAYLRDSVLDIATQNQDMLGCGEADTKVFERAWSQQAGHDADLDADALQEWSEQFGRDELWLGPVWFVVGLLRGTSMYGANVGDDDDDDEPDDLPPRISLTVPEGMKGKQSQYGWEIHDRSVVIGVTPLDREIFRQMATQYAKAGDMRLPNGAKMTNEVTDPFTVGHAAGTRVVQTLHGNAAPFSACYLLQVPGGYVNVQIVAKGSKKGIDLAKLEPMLATVRMSE